MSSRWRRPVTVNPTMAMAGIGLWVGLALLLVGVVGPLITRNPAHRKVLMMAIAAGLGLVLVAVWLIVSALGFGPDQATTAPGLS